MDHASIVAYVKQKASEVFRKDSYVSMRKRRRIRDLRRSKVSRERFEKSSVRSTFESRWILSNGFFRFLGRGSGDPSIGSHPLSQTPVEIASFHLPPPAQHRQIDIWIILGKIGFECFRRKPRGF